MRVSRASAGIVATRAPAPSSQALSDRRAAAMAKPIAAAGRRAALRAKAGRPSRSHGVGATAPGTDGEHQGQACDQREGAADR